VAVCLLSSRTVCGVKLFFLLYLFATATAGLLLYSAGENPIKVHNAEVERAESDLDAVFVKRGD